MTLGSGIFLSAIFIGCVFLYIKSDDKPRWRKAVLWSTLISISSTVIFFAYLIYNKELGDMVSSLITSDKDSYSQIKGIRLGESLSDLQFHHGEFKKDREQVNDLEIYKSANGVLIWMKNNKAEKLAYSCDDYADYTRLGRVRCGDNSESVINTFSRKNVDIKCFEKEVEWRYYEVKKHNISFVLKKNKVVHLIADRENIERPARLKDCS